MRRPTTSGWAEKQTPTPFLYHKHNLKQLTNCRIWGVYRYIIRNIKPIDMKTNRYLLGLALLVAGTMPAFSQVSNDNEDEVYKIDARTSKNDFVPGQVLVKFKDESPVKVSKARGMLTTNVGQLTSILEKYGANEMEKVLPNEKPGRQLRKSRAFNGETIQEKDLSQLYQVKLSDEHARKVMPLINELKALDEVEFAEPNYKVYLTDANIAGSFLGNPYITQQWYLEDYGVKQLWNKPIVNPERPVIAILDTGVDLTHPDLAPNLWTNSAEAEGESGYDNDGNGFASDVHGWDFINNTPNVRDYNMHGTHVAGIAAAANNGIGIVGANPMALIMPVSVMQSDGTGDVATIVKGIDYAVANGATVLNLSLGTYANSRALRQALEKAYQSTVIVAAAGNDGMQILPVCRPRDPYGQMFPAAYSFVLGVMATTQTGSLAIFSNFDCDGPNYSSTSTLQDPDGFNYELKAPGTNMLSTIPGGKYKVLQGTSMAAPLVAGAISALKMVKQYDTQEILWGDLLHTDNIAQAYALTNRPAELDLIKVMYRERKELKNETEEDYSNDGEIDAGETVSLYPVIRTTFGAASNIQMKLEMGDEFEDPNTVEILTPGWVNFGLPLSAYGKGVSLNPLQLKVASNVADNRHIKMKFTAKCDETSTLYEGHFTLIVNNMIKINGLISENRTLTSDHMYLVNDNIGILEDATLTIEPGTHLEFDEGFGIISFGKLEANGTPEKPIVFTGHNGAVWAGIRSHESTGVHDHDGVLYTNDEQTLFTLLPTMITPNMFTFTEKYAYYGDYDISPDSRGFYLSDYINGFSGDMTSRMGLLTGPNYLSTAVLQMLSDYDEYCSQFPYSDDKPNSCRVYINPIRWQTYDNPRDTLSFCRVEGYDANGNSPFYPFMKDCYVSPNNGWATDLFYTLSGKRNTITGATEDVTGVYINNNLTQTNIVNNVFSGSWVNRAEQLPKYSQLINCNYFNNIAKCTASGKYNQKEYWLANNAGTPDIDKSDNPSYLGTSREDIVRPLVYEIGNAPNTFGQIDLSNMRTTPIAEAHGIVWKVCVNGKDAQDEYEDLAPLGVGKHKFEVYFNRPMNKAVAPQISFGVRDPWTQNAVNEEGCWNEEGTIYTAYKTITGKTKSDGVNRIYVYGAEDNEYFEIPYEKTRFNVMINAAGSMATGFAAEAGLGRVELTWDNSHNDFEDSMGFNIYRYTINDEGKADTICINKEIVDIETTEYTDYDVTPGTTYYYMYKVLSTDLQEYDMSNVVAVTPLTSKRGDANGSGEVDVADVITTVNYAVGMEPKPFIFEAADMNKDQTIDIIDVVGIIQCIINPSLQTASTAAMAEAVYTIEDRILYVDSPMALAGVQVQLATEDYQTMIVDDSLNGFEHTSAWLSDNDYLFLAYNMNGKTLTPGKHALLHIGDAEINSIRLSDVAGRNVIAVAGSGTTAIGEAPLTKAMNKAGVYNLNGQKVAGNADGKKLQNGVYIINGKKVVK